MFTKKDNVYTVTKNETISHFPKGIFNLKWNPSDYELEATYMYPEFKLPSKLYDIDDVFINRTITNFNLKKQNFGVLLNGYRGTGKTMHSKIICNKLDLPTFIVTEYLECKKLLHFFTNIKQDCILFIDEYEKVYGTSDGLLSFMDGALNSKHKILFILTSNDKSINENLIDRPSRIYYTKNFDTLDPTIGLKIVDDNLKNKKFSPDFEEFLTNKISNLTIDVLMTLINEVNTFDCTPIEALKYMNITIKQKGGKFSLGK